MFLVGESSRSVNIADVRSVKRAEELDDVANGELVSLFHDYVLEWDQDCVPPAELDRWRTEGDDLADAVVRKLKLRPGQDSLEKVQEHLLLPEDEQKECVRAFWAEIAREPPEDVTALQPSAVSPGSSAPDPRCIPGHAIANPNYEPPPVLAEGQAVFWRYSAQIFSALLHFSLAGGFSANRIINVLQETNYLTGKARDHTYRRLLETTQAIIDYMNDMTPVTGRGWKSAIRVRLLHASVRVRIADGKGSRKMYDSAVDGVPINQEDMIATLGSFAIAPLWSLKRMGLHLTAAEELAYVATWRHIGYYLGITPARLRRHYSSVESASKLFACTAGHLLAFDMYTDSDPRATQTYRLLEATAGRPPQNAPVEQALALSRALLGDGLADRLALLPPSRRMRWRVKRQFFMTRSLCAFGRSYLRRWEVERVQVTRTLIQMIVCWQLGVRRTRFTIKEFIATVGMVEVPDTQGDSKQNSKDDAEKAEKEPNPDDEELDPEVKMGPVAAKALIRRWKWMLAEMGIVLAAVGLGTIGMGYGLYRRAAMVPFW